MSVYAKSTTIKSSKYLFYPTHARGTSSQTQTNKHLDLLNCARHARNATVYSAWNFPLEVLYRSENFLHTKFHALQIFKFFPHFYIHNFKISYIVVHTLSMFHASLFWNLQFGVQKVVTTKSNQVQKIILPTA